VNCIASDGKNETGEVRYYGSKEAIQYLKEHFDEWKWW
jgi:hypothetical protein